MRELNWYDSGMDTTAHTAIKAMSQAGKIQMWATKKPKASTTELGPGLTGSQCVAANWAR